MTSITYDEKTQLIHEIRDEGKSITSYDSVFSGPESLENNQSIVVCIHGKNAKICCQLNDGQSGKNLGSQTISWSHCHSMDKESGVDKHARKKLIFASILCLLFMIAEAVGGLLANSLAIATDAAHLLTDFASFMISLFSLWVASRPASRKMSFGWHRAEVIGALTSVLMIWVVTGILCFMAVERIVNKNFDIDAEIMVITASVGVIVNIIMGISLQVGGVPHSHSHNNGHHDHNNDNYDHDVEHKPGLKKRNINVRAAFIHVLGDFFQSVGVLIAAIVIFYKPEWNFIDPICTFLFSVLVLITTFNIIRDVLNVLMEGIPQGVDFLDVQRTLFNIPGVIKVHNLRIWSLSMDKTALSTHLAIAKGQNPTKILNIASREIKTRFDIYELTIQIEEYKDEMQECQQCQSPDS